MKFIKTTLIDSRTGTPLRDAPARNGSTINKGIESLFLIESTLTPSIQPWATPDIYGVITDESYYEELLSLTHVVEIDEETFWEIFKQELIDRAKEKKWLVETSGIYVGNLFISTTREDQARIHEAYTGRDVIGDGVADFTLGRSVVQMGKAQIEHLFTSIAEHVQECFSWQASLITQIESLELSLDNYKELVEPVLQAIGEFGIHYDEGDDTPSSIPEGEIEGGDS